MSSKEIEESEWADNELAAMKADDLRKVSAKLPLSAATLARNPTTAEAHNAPIRSPILVKGALQEVKKGKRIRQGEPKLSKWEQEWRERLEASGDWSHVKAQSLRTRLANGSWYKPDLSAVPIGGGKIHCWEVKGGAKMKGVAKGILALKVAASIYPEICWVLCYKENGEWKTQEVLP